MASSYLRILLLASFLLHTSSSIVPLTVVLPVTKDRDTLQYVTHIDLRTPFVSVNLVIDLGGGFLWVDCDSGYVSSSYRSVRCRSLQCSAANSTSCGVHFSSSMPEFNNKKTSCSLFPINRFTRNSASGELADDVIAVRSTDGSNMSSRFLFSCAPTFLLRGLARGVNGMVGLGRNRIGLPSQLATAFGIHRKFAIYLSSSTTSPRGAIFFGDGPYLLSPQNVDFSKSLLYTPLIINPISSSSEEYFIGVKSIKINGKPISLNSSLLSIDGEGVGGTKMSTVVPYTTLETSIYNVFTRAFVKVANSAAMNMTRVQPAAPFGACFRSENVAVPTIDLVLQSEMVYWRIHGENSMVKVSGDVMCLGFLDGGSNPRSSIVIGGYQMENNLVQFDLGSLRIGFSGLLLKK